MSTNIITIMATAGLTAERVMVLFDAHSKSAETTNHASQGSPTVPNMAGGALVDFIRAMMDRPADSHVLYFKQFVDHWTIAPSLSPVMGVLSRGAEQVFTTEINSVAYSGFRIPFRSSLVRRINRLLSTDFIKSNQEQRWFAVDVRQAIAYWRTLLGQQMRDSVLLIVFRPIGGSRSDEDIINSFDTLPDWVVSAPEK